MKRSIEISKGSIVKAALSCSITRLLRVGLNLYYNLEIQFKSPFPETSDAVLSVNYMQGSPDWRELPGSLKIGSETECIFSFEQQCYWGEVESICLSNLFGTAAEISISARTDFEGSQSWGVKEARVRWDLNARFSGLVFAVCERLDPDKKQVDPRGWVGVYLCEDAFESIHIDRNGFVVGTPKADE